MSMEVLINVIKFIPVSCVTSFECILAAMLFSTQVLISIWLTVPYPTFSPIVYRCLADGPTERMLKCGSVEGTLATVDFGPMSNSSTQAQFTMQRRYAPNG